MRTVVERADVKIKCDLEMSTVGKQLDAKTRYDLKIRMAEIVGEKTNMDLKIHTVEKVDENDNMALEIPMAVNVKAEKVNLALKIHTVQTAPEK